MDEATPADWQRLKAAIKAARVANTPKRAAFARQLKIDDSTMQILEGARAGKPSADMLDYVTSHLGWPTGEWRRVLAEGGSTGGLEVKPGISGRTVAELRPLLYDDARELGNLLRDGITVTLDLSAADDTVAKRLVDFAAGLAFGLHATVTNLGNRVLLISPALRSEAPAEEYMGLAAQFGSPQVSATVGGQATAGEENQDPDSAR